MIGQCLYFSNAFTRFFFHIALVMILVFLGHTEIFAKKKIHVQTKPKQRNQKLYSIVKDACPNEMIDQYYRSLESIIRHIPNVIDWEIPLKTSLYSACFLEMPPWRVKTAFNLAHGAIHRKYKQKTIEKIIASVGSKTIRIRSFLQLAMLWENLISLELEEYIVEEIFHTYLSRNYQASALEGTVFVYLQFLHNGLSHQAALKKTFEHEKSLQLIRDRYSAIREASKIIEQIFATNEKLVQVKSIFASQSENKTKKKSLDPKTAWVRIRKNFNFRKESLVNNEFKKWDVKKLTKFVHKWLSTPYRWGGFSKSGIDCSGFVIKVILNQFPGARLPRSAEKLSEMGDSIDFNNLANGDLVFFNASSQTDKITHVGIYIGDSKFAHASTKRGVTISVLNSKYYKKRFVMAKRLN